MTWVVYILKCADETFYTGITNNLDARVVAHSEGTGAKYTKGRGPFEVVYCEKCNDRSHASKREMAIKKLSRAEKLKLMTSK
ncbi:MAG: GIY-YIG nuclease family protein [Bdellovibrionales bacterium]